MKVRSLIKGTFLDIIFYVVALVEIKQRQTYHIITKQFGIITNVAGMVGDNAQTQTGHKSGLVK